MRYSGGRQMYTPRVPVNPYRYAPYQTYKFRGKEEVAIAYSGLHHRFQRATPLRFIIFCAQAT